MPAIRRRAPPVERDAGGLPRLCPVGVRETPDAADHQLIGIEGTRVYDDCVDPVQRPQRTGRQARARHGRRGSRDSAHSRTLPGWRATAWERRPERLRRPPDVARHRAECRGGAEAGHNRSIGIAFPGPFWLGWSALETGTCSTRRGVTGQLGFVALPRAAPVPGLGRQHRSIRRLGCRPCRRGGEGSGGRVDRREQQIGGFGSESALDLAAQSRRLVEQRRRNRHRIRHPGSRKTLAVTASPIPAVATAAATVRAISTASSPGRLAGAARPTAGAARRSASATSVHSSCVEGPSSSTVTTIRDIAGFRTASHTGSRADRVEPAVRSRRRPLRGHAPPSSAAGRWC